jgi:Protein kinase domain.
MIKNRFDRFNRIIKNPRFEELTSIGKGSFSEVFLGLHSDTRISVAIKKSRTRKKTSPDEYKIHLMINQLLLGKCSQNFLFVYHMEMNTCTISLSSKSYNGLCYYLFLELADQSLPQLHMERLQVNVFFQILTALNIIHTKYSLIHNDIKSENILILKVKQGGFWKYVINNESYFVENLGYIAFVSDFGVSRSFDPNYSLDGYLGERNAFVRNGKFEPFITDSFLSIDDKTKNLTKTKPYYFPWAQKDSGTRNRFCKKFPYPNSFDNLPPFEFFYDLQDLVRIFLGGKRLSQPGFHDGMPLSDRLKQKLEEYKTTKGLFNSKWELDSVKLFIAEEMIKDFCIEFDYFRQKTTNIIDKFE